MLPQSSVKQMMVCKRVNSTSHLEFHTEVKITKSSHVQKLVLFVHAGIVELVPLVQGGHTSQLLLEPDGVLFWQVEATEVIGGVVGCKRFTYKYQSLDIYKSRSSSISVHRNQRQNINMEFEYCFNFRLLTWILINVSDLFCFSPDHISCPSILCKNAIHYFCTIFFNWIFLLCVQNVWVWGDKGHIWCGNYM